MNRPLAFSMWLGIIGAVVWIILAAQGVEVMPSYLAGWLFWMALPLGALPLVLAMELLDLRRSALLPPLRLLLLLLPVGALFAIPLMIGVTALYHRPGLVDALPAPWMDQRFMLARMAVILLIWSGIALVFARPPRRGARHGGAILGLVLHVVLGSVAAVDWVMSLDAGIGSSAFGLLLISAQMGIALCVAVLMLTLAPADAWRPRAAIPLMAALLGAWAFMHFTQYLVVWSANLPPEIVWYQRRDSGLGRAAIWFAFAAAVVAMILLLPSRAAGLPRVMAGIAVVLLLVHLIETFWLVTPPFRGVFTIAVADLPALIGIGGLAVGTILALAAADRRRGANVRA